MSFTLENYLNDKFADEIFNLDSVNDISCLSTSSYDCISHTDKQIDDEKSKKKYRRLFNPADSFSFSIHNNNVPKKVEAPKLFNVSHLKNAEKKNTNVEKCLHLDSDCESTITDFYDCTQSLQNSPPESIMSDILSDGASFIYRNSKLSSRPNNTKQATKPSLNDSTNSVGPVTIIKSRQISDLNVTKDSTQVPSLRVYNTRSRQPCAELSDSDVNSINDVTFKVPTAPVIHSKRHLRTNSSFVKINSSFVCKACNKCLKRPGAHSLYCSNSERSSNVSSESSVTFTDRNSENVKDFSTSQVSHNISHPNILTSHNITSAHSIHTSQYVRTLDNIRTSCDLAPRVMPSASVTSTLAFPSTSSSSVVAISDDKSVSVIDCQNLNYLSDGNRMACSINYMKNMLSHRFIIIPAYRAHPETFCSVSILTILVIYGVGEAHFNGETKPLSAETLLHVSQGTVSIRNTSDSDLKLFITAPFSPMSFTNSIYNV